MEEGRGIFLSIGREAELQRWASEALGVETTQVG